MRAADYNIFFQLRSHLVVFGIDAKPRLGRAPGDPASTDPDGKIKQLYAQKERSGGFMHVAVNPVEGDKPAQLVVTWHDERGVMLHQVMKGE